MDTGSCPNVTALIGVNYKKVKAGPYKGNQFVLAKDKTILCAQCEISYAETAEIRVRADIFRSRPALQAALR